MGLVGSEIGNDVGSGVGVPVGSLVGAGIGSVVGAGIGSAVGLGVGAGDGRAPSRRVWWVDFGVWSDGVGCDAYCYPYGVLRLRQ